MKIDIEHIGPDGLDLDEPVTQVWLNEILGDATIYRAAGDGALRVHLDRMDDVVHVRGAAKFALAADCARCLQPVQIDIDTPLELTMVPAELEPQPLEDGEIADDDVGVSVYADRHIDLSHVVRDEVFLEMPMRTLCTPDCAGLCPQCGANLNEAPCPCRPQIDIRLSALADIKLN